MTTQYELGGSDVRVAAAAAQHALPRPVRASVSSTGLLVVFAEPVHLHEDDAVVTSLHLPDGHLHAVARVRRVTRGNDHTLIAALRFSQMDDEDVQRLAAFVTPVPRARAPHPHLPVPRTHRRPVAPEPRHAADV